MEPVASIETSDPVEPKRIDLNADLGESFGNWRMGDDNAMLDIVTSANIACGFHAGDSLTIRRTVAGAIAKGVTIGAHIGYNDLAGFGRRSIDIDPIELEADVLYQLAALDGICRAEGGRVRYVKAHGALYHRINSDAGQAKAFIDAVAAYDSSLSFLGAPVSLNETASNLFITECFADRAYATDGSLVPRGRPGAVLEDSHAVAAQALALATSKRFQSICLHGDTPGSVHHATLVKTSLLTAGFSVEPFIAPFTERTPPDRSQQFGGFDRFENQ
jgi:5-oxoprolinase (ATP-hydrolysing) subunit A